MGINDDNPVWLQQFIDIYQSLNIDNVERIKDIYHPNVTFEDPLHKVQGINELQMYFNRLYENLLHCEFTIEHYFSKNDEACIYWTMCFIHSKLNSGQAITVQGHSHLKGDDNKVIFHRDYLDVGAMLYEHISVLGGVIRFVKNKASQ